MIYLSDVDNSNGCGGYNPMMKAIKTIKIISNLTGTFSEKQMKINLITKHFKERKFLKHGTLIIFDGRGIHREHH